MEREQDRMNAAAGLGGVFSAIMGIMMARNPEKIEAFHSLLARVLTPLVAIALLNGLVWGAAAGVLTGAAQMLTGRSEFGIKRNLGYLEHWRSDGETPGSLHEAFCEEILRTERPI
jgi:hypothetical protein